MTKHKHRYVMVIEGGKGEMICECGISIRTIFRGARLVAETEDDGDEE